MLGIRLLHKNIVIVKYLINYCGFESEKKKKYYSVKKNLSEILHF